ncbi:NUMOD4 motif family protein [Enterococcus phage EF-P10]|nr:NUMOD4 motif family protein [Enterococcus phage EF-P10]
MKRESKTLTMFDKMDKLLEKLLSPEAKKEFMEEFVNG